MSQQIIIAEQARIAALVKDDRVDELIVSQGQYQIEDIFLGTVENVLPGIDAAFIDIGESKKNGFIHVSDLGPLRLKKGSAGITELLEPKQKVLVQVMKEPTGSKGPRLTGNISLPGKYIILQPFGQGVNISRKINQETERSRLRALGVLIKPPGTGLLFRTESEDINEELLIEDLETLIQKWENILQLNEISNPPILISRDEDFSLKILRDYANSSTTKVTIDNKNAIERAKNYLVNNTSNFIVEFHNNSKEDHILEKYKINQTIQKALQPRVDLPSGGYIIIEPTEALTVIDVNSGSFTRSANSRQTVLWTNCEAAIEIARQIKLRNIGGVLIIDFIDMDSRRDQFQLLEHFTSAIKDDSAKPQIAQLTELGLVELTRKRQGKNIYELFAKTCNCCEGLGHLQNLPNLQKISLEHSKSSKKLKKSVDENNLENCHNFVHEIKNKTIEKESLNTLISSEEKTLLKKKESNKESNDDINTPNHSNGQEFIYVKLSTEEKQVYSQLGINPLIKLGKQFIKVNNIPKLENDLPKRKEAVQPNNRKEKIINNLDNKLSDNFSKDDFERDKVDISIEQKPVTPEDLKENQDNEDNDITRRKRRRSSAGNE